MTSEFKISKKGQGSLEYLMLFGMVVILIIGGWTKYMADIKSEGDEFFESAAKAVYSHRPAARTFSTNYP